ncbi:MAG: hypothetical protein AAGG11_16130 [Pseudomonadota bacterium]
MSGSGTSAVRVIKPQNTRNAIANLFEISVCRWSMPGGKLEKWIAVIQSTSHFTRILAAPNRLDEQRNPMKKREGQVNVLRRLVTAVLWFAPYHVVQAESAGNLAQYPPLGIDVTITTAKNGMPILEPLEIPLLTGNYYRLNIHCPDVRDDLTGWRIEMPGLLRNAHLRLVSIGDIEVHLQGLSFNAIECDESGSAHVSLVPIKPGSYHLYVGNVPLAIGRPMGEAGIQTNGKYVIGRFDVR